MFLITVKKKTSTFCQYYVPGNAKTSSAQVTCTGRKEFCESRAKTSGKTINWLGQNQYLVSLFFIMNIQTRPNETSKPLGSFFFLFFSIIPRMGKKIAQAQHTCTYLSCVDLTWLLSQPNASWRTTRESFYGSPPNFSLTASPVSKPAPGRISCNTVSLDTPPSSIVRPLHARVCIIFFSIASFLVSSSHET